MSDAIHPDKPGEFVGDIWFGDPTNSTTGTHRWDGKKWQELPSELDAVFQLLASARLDSETKAARITALEEENKRLREALEPFAMIAKNVPLGWGDGEGFGIYTDGDYLFAKVSVRQLRRAAAALEKK